MKNKKIRTVFKFKNPLCNDSAFYSHFWEVMKGEKVHYFQIK
jgi:hypothetical protein